MYARKQPLLLCVLCGQHLQHRLRIQLGVKEYMSVIRYRAERGLAINSSTVSMYSWESQSKRQVARYRYRAGQYLQHRFRVVMVERVRCCV
jgi:hypothetical protein